ncbi:MAG: flippase-like domain-containing protein [Thermoleophilaceae bacterium]|nr:flippase-like domain-containing protein [Thermoleophilaceae bacterium]
MLTGDEPGAKPSTLLERAGDKASGIGQIGQGNPRLRLALQWGLAGLIFAFLVFFVIKQWNSIPDDFEWQFSPGWLVVGALGVTGFYVVQGELWRQVVHALGEAHLRGRPSRALWGKSLLARYVPTNALMVVGRMVMAEREGVPKRVTLASIAYELVLGFGTAVMVGAYFVIQLPDLEDQPGRYAVLILIPLVLVLLHPRVFAPLANFGLRKLGREPLPQVLSFGQVLKFSAGYIGGWAVIGLGVYAFTRALTPLPASDFPYVAAAYPVAFCVAVLTFVVPSGLGTRDVALAIAISAVLDDTVATAIAVGFRIFQTVIELLYVGFVVWLNRRAETEI